MTDYPRWQKFSLEQTLALHRVVMLTGPRQYGKTTLASKLVSDSNAYRTLDDLSVRQTAENAPHLFVEFASKDRTFIIDEIQKVPDLLPAIKKVVDLDSRPGQFLITGSADILNYMVQRKPGKKSLVTGIVLYAGDDIVTFGENLWAVPIDCM